MSIIISLFWQGTRMHLDPGVTDAFNALFVGHKWWVALPKDLYEFSKEFTCDKKCSNIPTLRRKNNFFDEHFLEAPDFDIENMLWYKHILPQIRYYKKISCSHHIAQDKDYILNFA